MFLKDLITLFERDLDKLAAEISAYPSEESMWVVAHGISNSGGNLCLHLIGNLSAYVGKEMGGFPYVRDREHEFAAKNIPRAHLLEELDKLKNVVVSSLEGLDDVMLEKIYPLEVMDRQFTYSWFLIHLYGHFTYHLGQINYHRRLLSVG